MKKKAPPAIRYAVSASSAVAQLAASGKLDGVAKWLPPPRAAIGERIGLVGTGWWHFDLWFWPEMKGMKLSPGQEPVPHVYGTALLVGWMKRDALGRYLGQYRPGSSQRFREPRAPRSGPVVWVLRKPILGSALSVSDYAVVRADYGDQPHVRERMGITRTE